MKILQCHSYKPEGGDMRFSAFGAKLPDGRTIEQAYQMAKRDEEGKPFEKPKGQNPSYLFLNGKLEKCTPTLRHQFYRMLWQIYFLHKPSLYNEACEYTLFRDKYADQGVVFSTEENVENLFLVTGGCNQARTIAQLIVLGWDSPSVVTIECLQEAKKRYLNKFPPKTIHFLAERYLQMKQAVDAMKEAKQVGEKEEMRLHGREVLFIANKQALEDLAYPAKDKTKLIFCELPDLSQPFEYNKEKKAIHLQLELVEDSPLTQQILKLLTEHNSPQSKTKGDIASQMKQLFGSALPKERNPLDEIDDLKNL